MRKIPKQARSRTMVDRILAAGADVLRTDGYAAFTTNRVAAAAGISPGSLYQYFPNKAAIIAEVVERWSAELTDQVAGSFAARVGQEGAEGLRGVIDSVVAALETDPALLRVVMLDLPPTASRTNLLALEKRVQEVAIAYWAGSEPGTHVGTHGVRSWVLVLAVEHLATRWVLDGQPIPREDLIAEMVTLTSAYLEN